MDKNKKNPKVKLGKVSIPPFEPHEVKVRISMFVDGDVIKLFKHAAEKRGMGYQTLMNEVLRSAAPDVSKTQEERLLEAILGSREAVERIAERVAPELKKRIG